MNNGNTIITAEVYLEEGLINRIATKRWKLTGDVLSMLAAGKTYIETNNSTDVI